MNKKIVVASRNPVKINAALSGMNKILPNVKFQVQGVDVSSGVADQPMSTKETWEGAFNRATNARNLEVNADYWVGMEGGIDTDADGKMFAFAWMCIIDKEDRLGKAQTGIFYLPPKVQKLVEGGVELGYANDKVFNEVGSKQKGGAVGSLTLGALGRTEYYEQAMILAMVQIVNPLLYPNE
ncbi:inosine/xanthosine triphosphatase [Flammeovirga kamogawensis]|uniref:Probable inosine/xanthosine triphosphatase n=1 Tax=Flammeovirga kamogawensis TaxID=373891 RepID=A0ABX8GVB4_9BACT|nr:inosine/xanthosine triphosphatase [Flammeovirga kamogawensis]MBB6459587.1 inosine/xanthosine triphosphatase [Flammeovirga kamogawensis]QWG07349.1 inosine/xanthosine triphosphatase [Flammeovirga kamogawensis]TRX69166.1 non-canonical purine NTP phosphatase [Flammeovirga kamogawensis]